MPPVKRPLSLLEVIIALGLTAILLTSLFSCYRHLVLTKVQVGNIRNALYPKLFTQARLIQIFDRLAERSNCHLEEGRLIFQFNNGLERDPEYCGSLKASLFLEDRELILELEDRKEILQRGVTDLAFSFFDPKKKSWIESWSGSSPPPQICIRIDNERTTFSIPNVKHEAIYP